MLKAGIKRETSITFASKSFAPVGIKLKGERNERTNAGNQVGGSADHG